MVNELQNLTYQQFVFYFHSYFHFLFLENKFAKNIFQLKQNFNQRE